MRKGGKYSRQVSLDETEEEVLPEGEADLSTLLIRKEDMACRKRVLEKLRQEKPLWYEVIMMSDLEGMDHHEIGKRLGISSNLVSVWKKRARHWLKMNYEKENKE
jgi:DNA-directed RNA polymerase specialized sigma24 family protein